MGYERKASRKVAKRGLRAHHKKRMKAKAVRAFTWLDPERAARLADHMRSCSCYACGNPRRHFGEEKVSERRLADRDAYSE